MRTEAQVQAALLRALLAARLARRAAASFGPQRHALLGAAACAVCRQLTMNLRLAMAAETRRPSSNSGASSCATLSLPLAAAPCCASSRLSWMASGRSKWKCCSSLSSGSHLRAHAARQHLCHASWRACEPLQSSTSIVSLMHCYQRQHNAGQCA